jgi:uncharacterized membrane protein
MTFADAFAFLRWPDLAALATLAAAWIGLGWWIEHPGARRPSVTILMERYRREWMVQFARREQRIFDAQILTGLRESTAFFASTTLIGIGGALALIGNPAPLEQAAEGLVGAGEPHALWRMKLIVVASLLGAGFLRFVWAHRVFGYSAVTMASVPADPSDPCAQPRAALAAELNIRAARNFGRGLRALYFALAAMGWLAGPGALALTTLAVGWVLWSREFLSIPHEALSRGE